VSPSPNGATCVIWVISKAAHFYQIFLACRSMSQGASAYHKLMQMHHAQGVLLPGHILARRLMTCNCRRWLSFHHVWYSVDQPSGSEPQVHPKNVEGAKPRLYLLNVRLLCIAASSL
jgi:hypothetical protein